jgi:hypothetical protein
MKKKSQIELLMPINEDIAGQHRTNKDVNNADDSEGTPGKSFTDDDFSEDDLKKEALGLFDIPAGAPDGAQNFRGRDSYKEEDFETSNKTGFGGESVIDIDEDEHPINIQRRDEFNSANNDENRKKDFFSFLGFKSTGRSMNKELEKLASVLSKSGYSDISDKITKFSSEEYDELMGKTLIQATNLTTWAASHSGENSGSAEEIKNHVEAEEYDKAIGSKLIDLLIKFINDAEPDFDDDELPAAKSLLRQMLSGSRSAEDTADKINKIYYANNLDSETREVISDASLFSASVRRLIKLEKVRLKDKEDLGKKKQEISLKKDKKELREAQWEAERVNSKIIDEWYDSKSGKYIAKNDRGEFLERNDATMEYEFVDGYPGAGWKIRKDDDFRLWRASKKYKVMQYKEDGEWKTYPLGKFAKEDKMKEITKRAISSRDNEIIKVADVWDKLKAWAKGAFSGQSAPPGNDYDGITDLPSLNRALISKKAEAEKLNESFKEALRNGLSTVKVDWNDGRPFRWKKLDSKIINHIVSRKDLASESGAFSLSTMSGFISGSAQLAMGSSEDKWTFKGEKDLRGGSFDAVNALLPQKETLQRQVGELLWRIEKAGQTGSQTGGGTGSQTGGGTGAKRGAAPAQPVKTYKPSLGQDYAGIIRIIDKEDHVWICSHKSTGQGCKQWAPLDASQKDSDVGWDVEHKVMRLEINGVWSLRWSGKNWVREIVKSSLSPRKSRLVKTGTISVRSARLSKLAMRPARGKKKKRKGGGGGSGGGSGTCGVPIQSGLNEAHFLQGNAAEAQGAIKPYKDLGKVDGNWGACSHSAWLLFLNDLEALGLKSKYKKLIPAYISTKRSSTATKASVQDAVKLWRKIGGSTPSAAASIGSFEDMQAQMGKEEEGKVFTDDLLKKYLFGEYDKKHLVSQSNVHDRLIEYGTAILKKPRRASRKSIISTLPPRILNEFKALFGTADEDAQPSELGWDWTFLKYRAGRGTYILSDILSGENRALVIASLKQEICKIEPSDTTSSCEPRRIESLKGDPAPRTNIRLDAEISAAKVESETADSKAQAVSQENMGKLSLALFRDEAKMNEALIALETEDAQYIASNGALVTQKEDMADMMRENREAGKIESMLRTLTESAAERFKAKLYSDATMYSDVVKIFNTKKGDALDANQWRIRQLALIEEAIVRAHRGLLNWRAGYLFEIILKDAKGTLKETDSSLFFGIGADTRQDILKEYMQQASNPANKMPPRAGA